MDENGRVSTAGCPGNATNRLKLSSVEYFREMAVLSEPGQPAVLTRPFSSIGIGVYIPLHRSRRRCYLRYPHLHEAASTGGLSRPVFRDAVTQALDQATQYARWVPPRNHDSLGVWLANNWWGIRWDGTMQESLVMDLARGNLLFHRCGGSQQISKTTT